MANEETLEWTNEIAITAILASVISILMGLMSMYWQSAFYILRNIDHIEARHPKSSLLCGLLCVIGLIFVWPYSIMGGNVKSCNYYIQHHQILVAFTLYMMLICSIGVYHVFTWRAFTVYFDVKWHNALQDKEWRLFLDPDENNWFLKNRNTWGNQKRIALILLIHILIFVSLLTFTLITTYKMNANILVLGASGLIPTICDIIIYVKYPKFDDIWGLIKEIKWTLATEFLAIIGLPLFLIIADSPAPSYMMVIQSSIAYIILFYLDIKYNHSSLRKVYTDIETNVITTDPTNDLSMAKLSIASTDC
eukprot:394487_1